MMSDYIKCPECGSLMVEREGYSKFYGCSEFPKCQGTRPYSAGRGKKALMPEDLYDDMTGHGECNRCGQVFSSRSVMGLCERCQEDIDNE